MLVDKEDANIFRRFLFRDAELNHRANGYVRLDEDSTEFEQLHSDAQKLVDDIGSFLDVHCCKRLSSTSYDKLVNIMHSWRRYFVVMGKHIRIPSIPLSLVSEPTNASKLTSRMTMSGIVVGISGRKTIKVEVPHTYKHPLYGKMIHEKKAYLVHDEEGRARIGDEVIIASCRPLSRKKRHRLFRIKRAASHIDSHSFE